MIRFGILGLGKIAHKFAHDIALVDGVELHGVGSRSLKKASAFAKAYSAKNYYDSYRDLIQDESIDVVYIATPHVFHFPLAMECLKAGKGVLVEKPCAMKTSEVLAMVAEARSRKLFLMEALWSRFIPGFIKAKEIIQSGAIGDLKLIDAKFAFPVPLDRNNRLTEAALGGGSLLDIGIYPIYLSLFLIGKPLEVQAHGTIKNGTDRSVSINFKYKDAQAILYSSFEHKVPVEATIYGTTGRLKMHEAFHECRKITIYRDGKEEQTMEISLMGHGYTHEIMEVRDCINNGNLQSDKMSWEDSIHLMELLDKVRENIGLEYDA